MQRHHRHRITVFIEISRRKRERETHKKMMDGRNTREKNEEWRKKVTRRTHVTKEEDGSNEEDERRSMDRM